MPPGTSQYLKLLFIVFAEAEANQAQERKTPHDWTQNIILHQTVLHS